MSEQVPNILVVDDDVLVRDSIITYLEDEGFICDQARDGQGMLDFLAEESCNLILLDLKMPRLTGNEALRKLREAGSDIPVIIMSGAGDVADVVEILRLGACDYLMKPILELELLQRVVRRALAEQELIRENQTYREELESLVRQRTAELEDANRQLSDKNTAMREILGSIQEGRKVHGERIAATLEKVVLPLLDQLRTGSEGHARKLLERVEAELKEISNPLVDAVSRDMAKLTSTELRVCHLIRRGMTAKEIADLEGVSDATVQTHRRNIRRKLGLANSNINLAMYLEQMLQKNN